MHYLKPTLLSCILFAFIACASKPEYSLLEGEMQNSLNRAEKEYQAGRLNRASNSYKEALLLAEVRGDEDKAAAVKISMGSIALQLTNYDMALRYYAEAQQHGHSVGDKAISIPAAIGLGYVYFKQQEYTASKQTFTNVLKSLGEATDEKLLSSKIKALNGLAVNLRVEGMFAEAVAKLDLCIALSRSIHDDKLLADTLHNKASLLFYKGEINPARELLLQALSLDKSLESLPAIASDYDMLAHIEKAAGNQELFDRHRLNAEKIRRYFRR